MRAWERILFTIIWWIAVAVPFLAAGLLVIFFVPALRTDLAADQLFMVSFGSAGFVLSFAAVCFSAVRAFEDVDVQFDLRVAGSRFFQAGIVMASGAFTRYAATKLDPSGDSPLGWLLGWVGWLAFVGAAGGVIGALPRLASAFKALNHRW